MLFTRFKDARPADKELLLVADPFGRRLQFGYMMKGRLYLSDRWEDGHCVYAIGTPLENQLHCNPNLAWFPIGHMTVKPKELDGEVVSLFKSLPR